MRPRQYAVAIAVTAFVGAASELPARADDYVSYPSNHEPLVRERVVTTEPNMPMIGTGVVTFAIPYTVSVVVGVTSRVDADRYLFIPIAGPWIDFARRPGCSAYADCGGETAAKVGLGFDGVFQAIGAIAIVSGFVWRRNVVVKERLSFVVAPYAGPLSNGVVAMGRF